MVNKVAVQKKFEHIEAYWTPKILGEVNDSYVKIFKAKGEFVWHQHESEDEFFFVVKGQLHIRMRDGEVIINEGEFFIVPKGVEHLPYAIEEAHVMLFEPKGVINTGNRCSDKTVENPEWI